MSDLMISYDPLLLIGQNRIFLLVACNDNFNAFLQIFLRCIFSVISDRTERRLVDDIGQLSTGCTGCHTGDLTVIYVITDSDLLCMYTDDLFPALQVR